MERDDFKNMDKKKKADYINDNLREGISFKDIYDMTMQNNELAKSKETLLNQFRKAGYRPNKPDKDYSAFDQQIITSESPEQPRPAEAKTNPQFDQLLLAADDLMQMLKWWKNDQARPGMVDSDLNMQIPGGEDIRKTLRINSQVWEEWKTFCSQQPGFSEKDLLARALLSFIKGQ